MAEKEEHLCDVHTPYGGYCTHEAGHGGPHSWENTATNCTVVSGASSPCPVDYIDESRGQHYTCNLLSGHEGYHTNGSNSWEHYTRNVTLVHGKWETEQSLPGAPRPEQSGEIGTFRIVHEQGDRGPYEAVYRLIDRHRYNRETREFEEVVTTPIYPPHYVESLQAENARLRATADLREMGAKPETVKSMLGHIPAERLQQQREATEAMRQRVDEDYCKTTGISSNGKNYRCRLLEGHERACLMSEEDGTETYEFTPPKPKPDMHVENDAYTVNEVYKPKPTLPAGLKRRDLKVLRSVCQYEDKGLRMAVGGTLERLYPKRLLRLYDAGLVKGWVTKKQGILSYTVTEKGRALLVSLE